MSYRALYRVFRPQNFESVIGQEHVSKTLKNAIQTNRVAHAYLFCGPRGTGKTSSAKIFAKAVNCLNPQNGEPCNQCENCRAINEDRFLDVLEIDAASNRGIDEIRELRDKVRFAPSQGTKKVYIIDEIHMLTTEAFNALLKTLEEPPEHVMFILATTDPGKLPLTILSRCQRFDFRRIPTSEIEEHLAEIVEEEQVDVSKDVLHAIARKSAGGMRDAISILDQCIAFGGDRVQMEQAELILGAAGEDDISALMDTVIGKDVEALFAKLNSMETAGKDPRQVLRECLQYVRQLLLMKVSPKSSFIELLPDSMANARRQVEQLTVEQLSRMLDNLIETDKAFRNSSQPQIFLETALIRMIFRDAEPATQPQEVAPKKSAPRKANGDASPEAPKKQVQKLIASEELLQQWEQVMQQVKKESVRLHAFLVEGQPAALKNGDLIIRFRQQYKFHCDTVSKPENIQMLSQIVSSLTGQPIRVVPELENENGNIRQELNLEQEVKNLFGDVPIEFK